MSQEELSEKCCVNPSYIGQIERGEKSPSLHTLYAIADGLDVDITSFFASPRTEQELAIQRLIDTLSKQTPRQIDKVTRICEILIGENAGISLNAHPRVKGKTRESPC